MSYATVNGLRCYYELLGSEHEGAETVLLLSGLGNDSQCWPGVVEALAERFRVLVMDNRGAGRTDAPRPPYSVMQMAGDAAGLLDALDVARAHVVGHSLGGFMALELALSHPERVGRLVLASTAARASARNRQLFANWVAALRGGMDVTCLTREVFLWMYPPACFEEEGFLERVTRETVAYPYLQPFNGLLGQVAALDGFDVRERLGRVRAETLVVYGGKDMLIPAEESLELAAGIPGAVTACLEGAGHLAQREAPEVFAKVVGTFLAGGSTRV
mgnify:CR=1 FL=1